MTLVSDQAGAVAGRAGCDDGAVNDRSDAVADQPVDDAVSERTAAHAVADRLMLLLMLLLTVLMFMTLFLPVLIMLLPLLMNAMVLFLTPMMLLLTVSMMPAGERMTLKDTETSVTTGLSLNGRLFVSPKDHLDALVRTS